MALVSNQDEKYAQAKRIRDRVKAYGEKRKAAVAEAEEAYNEAKLAAALRQAFFIKCKKAYESNPTDENKSKCYFAKKRFNESVWTADAKLGTVQSEASFSNKIQRVVSMAEYIPMNG